MRRVLILGCSGSGKSTLARRLATRLGLPVVHLDREFWRPGWRATPPDEFDRRVADLVATPHWVMDGNYARTLEPRLTRADTVVHLDFPTWRCLAAITKRTFLACNLNHPRPDMHPDCPEQWDWEFIEWVLNFRRTERPKTLRAIERHADRLRVITLTTRREVDAFLGNLPAPAGSNH
jgi:adenylate kinase family enzyme